MELNSTDKLTVLAKTQKDYKIFMPIMFVFLCGVNIFCLIKLNDSSLLIVLLPVIIICAAMTVICLISPLNAIVYDKEGKQLIIRAGQTFFAIFKRRYVLIEDIKEAYGVDNFFKKHLFISTKNELIMITTVSRPKQAAEKINIIKSEN